MLEERQEGVEEADDIPEESGERWSARREARGEKSDVIDKMEVRRVPMKGVRSWRWAWKG